MYCNILYSTLISNGNLCMKAGSKCSDINKKQPQSLPIHSYAPNICKRITYAYIYFFWEGNPNNESQVLCIWLY